MQLYKSQLANSVAASYLSECGGATESAAEKHKDCYRGRPSQPGETLW